jgi:hypothetical protein
MTTTAHMNGAVRDPRFVLLATSLGLLLAQIDTSVVNLGLKSIAIPWTQRNSLAAAAIAKRLRRRAGLFAEEACEM